MYVGHTAFTVRTTTMKVMREVGKTLKDYGFIDSIKEMNHYIQEI
jgi:ribosomal protein S8